MAECKVKENISKCSCTYTSCDRRGICCECVAHHMKSKQLPACFFPPEVERTYDRSFAKFVEIYKGKI